MRVRAPLPHGLFCSSTQLLFSMCSCPRRWHTSNLVNRILKEKSQRLVAQRHHCYQTFFVTSQTRQSRPLPVATGTATFVGNDDIAACVDILHWRSPCLPTSGRRVPLFTVGFFLLERIAQASVRVDTHWWLCSVNACRSMSSSRDLVTPSVQHVKLLNVALLSRPPSSWKSVRGAGRCVGVSRGVTKAMCLESDASVKSIDAVLGKVPLPCL